MSATISGVSEFVIRNSQNLFPDLLVLRKPSRHFLSMDGIIHINKIVVKIICLQKCNNKPGGRNSRPVSTSENRRDGRPRRNPLHPTELLEHHFPGFCRLRMNRYGRLSAQATMHAKKQKMRNSESIFSGISNTESELQIMLHIR